MLSLHAEACPELNGNSEGDVQHYLVRAWRFGLIHKCRLLQPVSCDYQVPFCNTGSATA